MGPLLRAVNEIADAVAIQYPLVAVDTLAYQYTLPPPMITKPRKNVIVRLCDIQSNSAVPLTDPSNADFNRDLQVWSNISQRLWIWNYVVDFGDLLETFANYYVMGANIKYFAKHGVTGVFEEGPGAQEGDGTDLEELKDFVMAELLWDPTLDQAALIAEFCSAYYGDVAAPYIHAYMDTMHDSAVQTKDFVKACCVLPPAGIHKAYLTPMAVLTSAQAFADALKALNGSQVAGRTNLPTKTDMAVTDKYRERVERGSMAVTYVVLWRWDEFRAYAQAHSLPWPIQPTKESAFEDFGRIFNKTDPEHVVCGHGNNPKGPENLKWLRVCIMDPPNCCVPGNGCPLPP